MKVKTVKRKDIQMTVQTIASMQQTVLAGRTLAIVIQVGCKIELAVTVRKDDQLYCCHIFSHALALL